MDKKVAQNQLTQCYETWKDEIAGAVEENALGATLFGPPLLIQVTESYCKSSIRVLVYGQETRGWTWSRDINDPKRKWLYPDFKFSKIESLADFAKVRDSVQTLLWGYENFNFAAAQPETYSRSIFWQAFRRVENWPHCSVLWANLIKCDYNGGRFCHAPTSAQKSFIGLQKNLILKELEILQPHVCLFLTGTYDAYLMQIFSELAIQQVDAYELDQIARLETVDKMLPCRSYRTYHPRGLRRKRLEHLYGELQKIALVQP